MLGLWVRKERTNNSNKNKNILLQSFGNPAQLNSDRNLTEVCLAEDTMTKSFPVL